MSSETAEEREPLVLGGRHAPPAALLVPPAVPARDVLGRQLDRPRRRSTAPRPTRPACTPIEEGWLERMRTTAVVRLPAARGHPSSRTRRSAATGLQRTSGRAGRGAVRSATWSPPRAAAIELRVVPNLWPLWNASLLDARVQRHALGMPNRRKYGLYWRSGQRPLLCNAGPAREARRRRAGLPDHEKPGGDSASSPAILPATGAIASGSAFGPTQSTTAPPSAVRAAGTARRPSPAARAPWPTRHRMVRAAAPPPVPGSTSRFGRSACQRLRNSHFRRRASSSVTSRSGQRAARGIPGVPPPEPTSTIAPSRRARARARASESSSRARRASTGSRSAVSPGVARTPASQRSSRSDAGTAGSLPSVGIDGGGPRRSGSARCLRSPSRPRDRPSGTRARPSVRPRSSARAPPASPWRRHAP